VRRVSEDAHTVADAVVMGSLLITLLRHSRRVKSACLAQLVNAISVIRSEPGGPSWRQTTFHPFALTARHAKGNVLEVVLQCPDYETEQYGTVPMVDATATHDPRPVRCRYFWSTAAKPSRSGSRSTSAPCRLFTPRTPWSYPTPTSARRIPRTTRTESSLDHSGRMWTAPSCALSCRRCLGAASGCSAVPSRSAVENTACLDIAATVEGDVSFETGQRVTDSGFFSNQGLRRPGDRP